MDFKYFIINNVLDINYKVMHKNKISKNNKKIINKFEK